MKYKLGEHLPGFVPLHLVIRDGLHGRGGFATRRIPAGALVVEMGGVVITADETRDDLRCMQIDHTLWLAEHDTGPQLYDLLNHSCDPNLGFTKGTLEMFALRDIEPGDELTWDYSTSMNEPGWRLPCACGAGICRGEVRSFCDLDDAQRQRLRPLALRYLRS